MKKVNIHVYSKLNNIEENNDFLAVNDSNYIKYLDLENNKMIIDMKNNIITRENIDYLFNMRFNDNKIDILVKKLNKNIEKDIKTLIVSKRKNDYLVRYLLTDENIINEYYVKF